jgi:CheY-like chemotaxis protein
MANEKQPNLILLDMMLPKMSGLEVLKALKKEPATEAIPVVVLTGLSEANSGRLRLDGAFGFLPKTDLGLDQGEEFLVDAVRKMIMELPGPSLAQAVSSPHS